MNGLGQEQIVREDRTSGSLGCFFFFFACNAGLSSKTFIRLQAEIYSPVCGFEVGTEESPILLQMNIQITSSPCTGCGNSFTFYKQKVSQYAACDSKNLFV